jgi:DNA-binding transcriptional MerR regulator
MDTTTISVIVSVMAIVFTIATFFVNRSSNSAKDGERWGRLNKELEYMGNDLKEIKSLVKSNEIKMNEALEQTKKSTKESLGYLHERLDNHLRDEHGMKIPKRNC